jgi:uridine kinase
VQLLLNKIDQLLVEKERVVVAIDGKSTAGKSTLAASLKEAYSCSVISMDHFFLRPEQRTPERLSQPGGNIDHDRFIDQVIAPLEKGEPFVYYPYDCKTGKTGDPITVSTDPLIVIEGAYSMHPYFSNIDNERSLYDITVFLYINDTEQNRRLLSRNPHLYERFIQEWVPMENKYFEYFHIAEKCDFVFESDDFNDLF